MTALLEVRNLSHRFQGLAAVSDLSLSVNPREIFSLIGPNGAGKTTVFNVLAGIYPLQQGELRLAGERMERTRTWRDWAFFVGAGLLIGLIAALAAAGPEALFLAFKQSYVYGRAFSCTQGLADLAAKLRDNSVPAAAAFVVCGLIGSAGAWSIWSRQRRSPDAVARMGVARTFQNIRLFKELTVLENVLVALEARSSGRPRTILRDVFRFGPFLRHERELVDRARGLLDIAGLSGRAGERAGSLPYGEQRLLEIARALATGPQVLLLDEPAAGMNPVEVERLMGLLRRLREQGLTIFLIEHRMQLVMGISDRIVVLDGGEKIAEGRPEEVRNDPKVIEAYLGKEVGRT